MLTLDKFLNQYQKVPIEEYPNQTALKKPLVTVCVFAFNHAAYIAKCLDSILMQQTNFDFIIYLGEDVSEKDNTREICIEYAEKYPDKIRLILQRKENKFPLRGRPSGRFNIFYGFLSTQSKYIALCDGDDYWTDPLKLQKQVDFLEANSQYGICCTNFNRSAPRAAASKSLFTKSLFYIKSKNRSFKRRMPNYPDSFSFDFSDALKGVGGATVTMVFERKSLDMTLLFDSIREFISADYAILCLITLKKNGYRLNENTGVYNIHNNGTSTIVRDNLIEYFRSKIVFLKYVLENHSFSTQKQKTVLLNSISKAYLRKASLCFESRKWKKGITNLNSAVKLLVNPRV